METKHSFTGGMQSDSDPQFQPVSSYPYAENWILTPTGQLLQEKGTRNIGSAHLPVVGMCALNGQEIVFSSNGTLSEIGYLDGDTYTQVLQSTLFTLHYPTRATARIDYRGHRLVYWGDDYSFRWLDLDSPTTNLPAGLEVLANPISPVVTLASVQGGGSLPTGVYQASATLLTLSKNESGYGLFTGIIPILNEDPLTSPRQLLDGAPTQTVGSGSITFHLDNLDPTYGYVQLVVGTYTGIGNTLVLHKLPLIPLNGRTSLDYTYYSFSQHVEDATLSEILGQLPDYVSAKEVIQKDGRLLAAGLKTSPDEHINWQAVANSIILGPAIKEVNFQEESVITHYVDGSSTPSQDIAPLSYSKEDYKNPLLTESGKGLQRDEVYSFCFIPIVKGRRLEAYHIPATIGNSQAFSPYYSLEQYPTGSYPTGSIRHHKMPSLLQEPLLGVNTIRILGVKELSKPDLSTLTTSQQANVTGYLIGMQSRDTANRSILAQGILNPLQPTFENYCYYVGPFDGKPNTRKDEDDGELGNLSKEYAAFYSPETSITQDSTQGSTSLEEVGTLSGISYGVADRRNGGLGTEFGAIFLNYTSLAVTPIVSTPLLPAVTSEVAPHTSTGTFIVGERLPISTTSQNGFSLLKADLGRSTGIPYQGVRGDVQYKYRNDRTSEMFFLQSNGTRPNGDDANWKGVTTRKLYNVKVLRSRQYGSLEQATYFPVFSSTVSSPLGIFFQGDTFIGKVALMSATQEYTDKEPGLGFLTMSYFFCESTVNVNYRHYVPAVGDMQGTLAYYPKVRTLWSEDGSGVMQYPTGLGQASGYNKQYSFTNTLTPFFPKDNTIETVTSYPNRILYSAQGVEGEQLDAYRIVRANDYHDIPKDRGAITSLFILSNTLYTHTTGATYKNFFNEAITQTTSEGEVTLGNGGLFNRPSIPLVTIDGGYAGCQDAQAAITTPSGHFFPDAFRGKVFNLGDGLSEISKKGLFTYFQDTLKLGSIYKASYDYQNERYLLAGKDVPTISYSTRSNQWVSFHSYFPDFLFSTPSRQLLCTTNEIGILNEGTTSSSRLDLITNEGSDISKLYSQADVHSSNPPSLLACYTNEQASGGKFLVPYTTYGQEAAANEVLYCPLNDQYQLKIPRDIADGRLQGKWLKHSWTFSNLIFPTLLRLLTLTFTPRSRS